MPAPAARRVFKYELGVVAEPTVLMPCGGQVLHLGEQGNHVFLWALVDPDAPAEHRTFRLLGTGHPVPAGLTYLGTFMLDDGAFVGHLFEDPA